MRLRHRPGIEPAVLLLATLVLMLTAVSLLMLITATGTGEAAGYLEEAEADVDQSMQDQASGVQQMIEQRLADGLGSDIIVGHDPC